MVTTQNFVLRMLGSPGDSTDGAGFQGEMQPRTWMLQTAGFQFHCLLAPISDSVQFFVCLLFFVLFCPLPQPLRSLSRAFPCQLSGEHDC